MRRFSITAEFIETRTVRSTESRSLTRYYTVAAEDEERAQRMVQWGEVDADDTDEGAWDDNGDSNTEDIDEEFQGITRVRAEDFPYDCPHCGASVEGPDDTELCFDCKCPVEGCNNPKDECAEHAMDAADNPSVQAVERVINPPHTCPACGVAGGHFLGCVRAS